jgi:hypothetical protein
VAQVTIHRHEYHQRLPLVCVRCGAPATHWVEKTFGADPLWGLIFLPVFVILPLQSRRTTIDLPVCDADVNPWREFDRFRRRMIDVFFGGLFVLVMVVSTSNSENLKSVSWILDGLAATWVLAFVGLGVAALVFRFLSIRAVRITADSVTLANVAGPFAEALALPHPGDDQPAGDIIDERIRR